MKRPVTRKKMNPAAGSARLRGRNGAGTKASSERQEQGPMMRELHRKAEVQLRKQKRNLKANAVLTKTNVDTLKLLHELQVHHVELEMQNYALKEARDNMETLLAKYADLYDFAPIGYLSLDEQGRIQEVNLTGAHLFGLGRNRLINQRLLSFVDPASQSIFRTFLENVLALGKKQFCEARIRRENGSLFWGDFQGTTAISPNSSQKWCRVVVSDITQLKRVEESEHQAEALAASNKELKKEIVQRHAAQESLQKSKQDQSLLLEQSHHMQAQLRHLSRQVLQAQEDERKRISRELHDVIAQTLTGINIRLATLKNEAALGTRGLDRSIARTQRLVEKSVDIVHQFALELRPTVLDDLGLIPALHSFMKSFFTRTGIRTRLTAFKAVEQLDTAGRTVLYRVTQEALTNVARHAQAGRVAVSIQKLSDRICMKIKDDGKSFQAELTMNTNPGNRLGLLGMRERVEMVGGTFCVESAPGKGTTIIAHIPLGKIRAGGAAEQQFESK